MDTADLMRWRLAGPKFPKHNEISDDAVYVCHFQNIWDIWINVERTELWISGCYGASLWGGESPHTNNYLRDLFIEYRQWTRKQNL